MSRGWRGYTVRRATLTGVAIAALIAGVAATSAALHGEADPGVVVDPLGGRVVSVSPTGFAWRYGVRAGQIITAVSPGDDPGGWRLDTEAGGLSYVAVSGPAEEALRDSLPLALAGLGAGALAIVFLRTHRRWVLPAASLALILAATPLWLQGAPLISTVAMAGAAVVPGGWLILRLWNGWLPRAIASLTVAVMLGIWAAARLTGSGAYEQYEGFRSAGAWVGFLGLVGERGIAPILAGERFAVTRPRFFDVAAVAALAGLALALVYFLAVSPILVGVVLVIVVLVFPPLRRMLGGPIRDALLADVRAQAATQGAEEERDRLARQLHDVPLQEIVGVIRRLEIVPGTTSESDDLRAVAGHLRDIASELRPPVLDDFGLPAALEYVAEEARTDALPVVADIADHTGFGPGQRPPAVVELEVFRITREAVANSVRHSSASRITVVADVAPDRVEVVISDDGAGFDRGRRRAAGRRQRMGLSTMRRRAQAIDAELTIDGRHGTRVTLIWHA